MSHNIGNCPFFFSQKICIQTEKLKTIFDLWFLVSLSEYIFFVKKKKGNYLCCDSFFQNILESLKYQWCKNPSGVGFMVFNKEQYCNVQKIGFGQSKRLTACLTCIPDILLTLILIVAILNRSTNTLPVKSCKDWLR